MPTPVPRTPAPSWARPLSQQPKPFERQQRQQRSKSRRAAERVPARSDLPLLPRLEHYTPQQRAIIRDAGKRYTDAVRADARRGVPLERRGSATVGALEGLEQATSSGSQRERDFLHKLGGIVKTDQRNEDAHRALAEIMRQTRAVGRQMGPPTPDWARTPGDFDDLEARLHPAKAPKPLSVRELAQIGRQIREAGETEYHSPKRGVAGDTKLAGIPIEAAAEAFATRAFPRAYPGLKLLRAPDQLARATIEDPGKVLGSSARTAKELVSGIPQGLKMMYEDVKSDAKPDETLKAMFHDYSRRYGALFEGDYQKFRENVKKSSGLTPFVLDALAATRGVGIVGGVTAKSGILGERLARVMTDERPGLRFSGGRRGVKRQELSNDLFRAARQRTLDRLRARRFEHEANRRGHRLEFDEEGFTGRLVTDPENPRTMPALRPGRGEVLPYYSPRENRVTKRLTGRRERDVGGSKGTGRVALLTKSARVERTARRAVNSLNDDEARFLKYAMQYGLTLRKTGRARIVGELTKIRDRMAAAREEAGVQPARVHRATNDEVAILDRIIAEPERFITSKVDDVRDVLHELEHKGAGMDPALTADRASIRRNRPQGEGIDPIEGRRGPDVQEFHDRLDQIESALNRQRMDANLAPLPPGTLHDRFGGIGHLLPADRDVVLGQVVRTLEKDGRKSRRDLETALRRQQRQAGVVEGRNRPIRTPEVRAAEAELNAAQTRLTTTLRAARRQAQQTGRAEGRAGVLVPQALRREQARVDAAQAKLERAAQKAGEPVPAPPGEPTPLVGIAQRYAVPAERKRVAAVGELRVTDRQVVRAQAQVNEARRVLREKVAAAPRVSDKQTAKLAAKDAEVAHARSVRDELDQELALAKAVQAGKGRGRLESAADYEKRVAQLREDHFLEAPVYYMSSPRPTSRVFAMKAIGTGGRAVADDRTYTGALRRLGLEENHPDVVVRGLLRNVKRRFSWALVVRNVETHAYEWSRGRGGGLTAEELRREFERRSIDPDSVEIINTARLTRRQSEAIDLERGQVLEATDPMTGLDTAQQQLTKDALEASRVRLDELEHDAEGELTRNLTGETRGMSMNRYVAMPKDVVTELSKVLTPTSGVARGLDMLLTSMPARLMLGAFNVSWLTYQIASNAFLAGLGTKGRFFNPLDHVGAVRWWKSLTEDQRDAIAPYVGIGHHTHLEKSHFGAAANNRFAHAWRAFTRTRVLKSVLKKRGGIAVGEMNPLDAFFKIDQAQNNYFRRVVLYDQARRQAYRNMGGSFSRLAHLHDEVMSAFTGTVPEQLKRAADPRFQRTLEEAAAETNKWLGNYVTYSNAERAVIARSVMFYGYLRFSARFALWTMPVDHPIMADMLANLGRMGSDEVKRLLGVPLDYDVPMSMLGKMFIGSDVDFKKGAGTTIPFNRMNPFMNSAFQMEGPNQVFTYFSPWFQALVDQAASKNLWRGKDWRINGETTPYRRPKDYYGGLASMFDPYIPGIHEGSPRGRILEETMLGIIPPYRMAEEGQLPFQKQLGIEPLRGSQSDDALLGSPRQIRYADESINRKIDRAERTRPEGRAALLPGLLGVRKPDLSAIVLMQEIEREKELEAQRKPGKPKRRGRKSGSLAGSP